MSISSVFKPARFDGQTVRDWHNGAVSAQPRPDRERGVFETLLVLEGRAVELDAHLARLEKSLASLFPGRNTPRGLGPRLEAAARRIGRGALRLVVAPAGDSAFAATIETAEIKPGKVLPPAPASVRCQSLVVPGGLGAHKWADRRLVERAEEGLGPDTVPLIVDWDGSVLEASRANVFAVVGGALLTPHADGRILAGVSRAGVLRLATGTGFEIREAALPRERLGEADEVFLTSSVRGVELVEAIDGTPLAGDGAVAVRVAAAMRQAWSQDGLDRVPRR